MDTQLLIKKAQDGDKEAREQLINDNVGLVWSIVRRYMGRGQEAEDLFQIGVIGLMKAVDKFDLSYEVMFSTYAVPMIAGEIKRYFGDKVYKTVISRNVRLSEAPSHGVPIQIYDRYSKGALAYREMAREFLARNKENEIK